MDLAITSAGEWYVLFAGGRVVILDRQGQYRGLLDGQDGVPSSARRLLLDPASGDLLVGSMREGIAVVRTRTAQPAARQSRQ